MKENTKTHSGKRLGSFIGGDKLILIGAIIVVYAIFTAMNPNFLSMTNFVNILVACHLVGLVAIGHTYLIIAGQNDLSPGSVAAMAGVIMALLLRAGVNLWLSLLITILAGVAVGLFNAWMVNCIHLEAFIATLVSQSAIRGVAFILCAGLPVAISHPGFIELGRARLLGIPIFVWITLVAFVVFGFILAKTRFGRSIYAIGGNADAARLAGLNPKRIILICYIMMGIFCSIGGALFAARMNAGQPSANVNLEFDAITAVILGGVSFSGGVGGMAGTVLGVFLIQAFNTGLTMVNIPTFWQYVARGGLLLFALTSDYIRRRNRERSLLEASKKNA